MSKNRKVFLSFLGNTNYKPCNYYWKEKTNKVNNVRFIQEASAKLFCNEWRQDDRILIFLTDQARNRNWEDADHIKDICTGEKESHEGLKNRLKKLNLEPKIEDINIPDGISKHENPDDSGLWEIFIKVYNQLRENDRVYLDITHAFRFLPMLVMVLINYAKFLKSITVEQITYGAFEANPDSDDKPIINLTQFSELQEWTEAVSAFSDYGRTKKIVNKLDNQKHNQLIDALLKVETNFITVRGQRILHEDYPKIKSNFENLKEEETVSPLKPILNVIKDKINIFEKAHPKNTTVQNSINNTLNAVKWCIDHDLIQQGITLLQESLVTIILIENSINYSDENKRKAINAAFHIYENQLPFEKWKEEAKKEESFINGLISNNKNSLVKLLYNEFKELTQLRNDLNHGGYSKNMDGKKIASALYELYDKILKEVYSYYNLLY